MDKIITILNEETFTGADGNKYLKVTKEIQTPRKTYVRGVINGKYRGNQIDEEQLHNQSFFDFEIYEASLSCEHPDDFQKNIPFEIPSDNIFPKEKLPKTLLVELTTQNNSFGINILEPIVYDFETIRKLHQTDGDEVFGSFNAGITGYIFDYESEIVEEIVLIPEIIESLSTPPLPPTIKPCQCSNVVTGNTERNGNYQRKEYLCKHHNDKIWGKWEYNLPSTTGLGCWSILSGLLVLILGIIFFVTILPGLIYFIPIALFFILLNILAPYLKWFFRIIGIGLLVLFVFSITNSIFRSSNNHYVPKPTVVDNQKEQQTKIVPIEILKSTSNSTKISTNMIKKYRIWSDYENKKYEGYYYVMQNDLTVSTHFKNSLTINQDNTNNYDKIIYNLKENDKTKLGGVYQLFDSINAKNKLSKVKFAEMIVTFIQDIPYSIILDNDCNANLYADRFTREYLRRPNSICEGNQRFGITTPLEFLASLKGDCDSRTLLLYTILSHYNYDVAVLSSEFYGHSTLGINLPINGVAYQYRNQKYIMWETTATNYKPGIIPNDISNLTNWRISLKSK